MDKTIYLVRHAKPMPRHLDPQRGLSALGRKEAAEVTERLIRSTIKPIDRIFHSEKLRARQTAEIIGAGISPPNGIHEVPGLLPDDDVDPWIDELTDAGTGIMLVGHMPFMSLLRDILAGGGFKPFATSEVACLESIDDRIWVEKLNIVPGHPEIC